MFGAGSDICSFKQQNIFFPSSNKILIEDKDKGHISFIYLNFIYKQYNQITSLWYVFTFNKYFLDYVIFFALS